LRMSPTFMIGEKGVSASPDSDILNLSGLPPDGKILEIGCGPGNATVSFARLGYSILGIEWANAFCFGG